MRITSRIGVGAVAVATLAGLGLSGTANAAPSSRATVSGSVPSWATASTFKHAASGSDTVAFRVYLDWRNAGGAAALARAVSTPGSAEYGKFLTPAQFRAAYAPTQSDVTAVQQWLRGSGFTVGYTPANNHYVEATGTVAQANAAFATTLGDYVYAGQTLLAPERALSVPASLPPVSGVIGLDDSAALVHTDHVVADALPSAGFRNAPPLSAYWGEKTTADTAPPGSSSKLPGAYPWAVRGYHGKQLQGAYGLTDAISSGDDGHGVTVAIIDAYASPTIAEDAATYFARVGLPAFKGGQFSQVVAPGTYRRPDNPRQGPSGWYGEETLDVEAVHTSAPGANIVFVSAPNNYQDLDAALNHVVDRHLADIVSNSYGWSGEALPAGFIKPQNDTLLQATLEGIGVYFSSGDYGDETFGTANPAVATPDWPASSPYVTAVGGTSLGVGSSNDYLFETGWETAKSPLTKDGTWGLPPKYQYGSGGGTSRLFPEPDYQKPVVPEDLATAYGDRAQPMRVVPDVAMVGDPNTGMLVGQTQTFPDGTYYDEYRIGGTSLACPLFAGVMALAQQRRGAPIGFANPTLYKADGGAFHDVLPTQDAVSTPDWYATARADYANGVDATDGVVYSLRWLGKDDNLTIHAAKGYDDVTGRGTPDGEAFLSAVAGE